MKEGVLRANPTLLISGSQDLQPFAGFIWNVAGGLDLALKTCPWGRSGPDRFQLFDYLIGGDYVPV